MAGIALSVGLDPLAILECDDPIRLLALEAAVDEAWKLQRDAREDLARRIAKAVNGNGS